MQMASLNELDLALIEEAKAELKRAAMHDWHGVASALRLRSGATFAGRVLEAEVSSLTICAEPITIGKALEVLPDDPADCIVAVRKGVDGSANVIPPCGRCREIITDYCPNVQVIIEEADALFKVAGRDLLPFKYQSL